MPIKICPNCSKRITVGFDTNDFVHDCSSGNPVIDQEDVVKIGNWEDFDGIGSIAPQAVMRQGLQNQFFGEKAGVEGYNKERLTDRGKRASTRRQRRHFEFIDDIRNK